MYVRVLNSKVSDHRALINYVLSLFTICTDISTLIFVIEIRERRRSDTIIEQLVRCNGHYIAVRWGVRECTERRVR
jgi:hypothetical protein